MALKLRFNVSDWPDIFSAKTNLISGLLFSQLMSAVLALCIVLAIAAIVANVVTIMVYRKMGFVDSTNVSLTALAFSDLGGGVTAVMCALAGFLPALPNAKFTFEIITVYACYPHVMFSRISALITTYISVERYLCVLVPLHIKRIITTGRTFIAMVGIFVVSITFNLHLSLRFPVGWKFYSGRNQTLLGVLAAKDPAVLTFHDIRQVIYSSILPIFTIGTMVVTTILLSVSLQKNKAWRDTNKTLPSINNSERQDKTSTVDTKEARAIKMVITITTVFIISSIPSSIHQLAVMTVTELEVNGAYSNLFALTGTSFLLIDCINCSANVIIYYKMSTKFRNAVREIFLKHLKKKNY